MDGLQKGKLIGFAGSWGSGIGYLVLENSKGKQVRIPCENGPTVRALDACFGVIGPGHCVDLNSECFKNKVEIYYAVDDLGLLSGFTPATEDNLELEEACSKK